MSRLHNYVPAIFLSIYAIAQPNIRVERIVPNKQVALVIGNDDSRQPL
jgi:hypothetical protein